MASHAFATRGTQKPGRAVRQPVFARLWPVELPVVETVLLPLTPAAYLRLRLATSGLSVARVVERVEPRIAHRGDVRTVLDLILREGSIVRDVDMLQPLRTAFAFDPEVYAQLRDEPPSRHPSVCRGCGCSQSDPCVWSEHRHAADTCCALRQHSCSRCVPDQVAA